MANRMPKQNPKYPWGQGKMNEAKKSIELAEQRLERAKKILAHVEMQVAENLENAARLRLEAKQERLQKQLKKTQQELAAQPA